MHNLDVHHRHTLPEKKKLKFSVAEIAEAFRRWHQEYEASPELFMSPEDVAALTADELAEARSAALLHYLGK